MRNSRVFIFVFVLVFCLQIAGLPVLISQETTDNPASPNAKNELLKILLTRAKKHLERGRIFNAETTLTRIVKIVAPENVEAKVMLSKIYFDKLTNLDSEYAKTFEEDIKKYMLEIIGKNPKHSQANFMLAKLYQNKREFAKAKEHAQKAIIGESNNAEFLVLLGDLNLFTGKTTIAKALYKKALVVQPDNIDALTSLFHLLAYQGEELPTVIEIANKILKSSTTKVIYKNEVCINTALHAINAGNIKIANEFLSKNLELSPRLDYRLMFSAVKRNIKPEILATFIEICDRSYSPTSALNDLKNLDKDIEFPEINLLRALLYYYLENYESSNECLKKASIFDTSEFPEYKLLEAEVSSQLELLEVALQAYQILHNLNPTRDDYKLHFATLKRIEKLVAQHKQDGKTEAEIKELKENLFTANRFFFQAWLATQDTIEEQMLQLNQALNTDADHPWANKLKGFTEFNAYYKWEQAYNSYSIAYKYLTDDQEVLEYLAVSAMMLGDEQKLKLAEELMTKLMYKYPEISSYRQYLQLITEIQAGAISPSAYGLYFQAVNSTNTEEKVKLAAKSLEIQENLFESNILLAREAHKAGLTLIAEAQKLEADGKDFTDTFKDGEEALEISELRVKQSLGFARNDIQKNEALFEFASLLSSKNMNADALNKLKPVLQVEKPTAEALFFAANLNLKLKNYFEAHRNMLKLIRLYPTHSFIQYEHNSMFFGLEDKLVTDAKNAESPSIVNLNPQFEKDKTYNYSIALELSNFGGKGSIMATEFRVAIKIIESSQGFTKVSLELLGVRGSLLFDDLMDQSFTLEISSIFGLCAFKAADQENTSKNNILKNFKAMILPSIIELFSFSSGSELTKLSDKWVKRTQGGMTHLSNSNECSILSKISDNTAVVRRFIKAGNEFSGLLADFYSNVYFDLTTKIASEMTYEFWTLIPDITDKTGLDRLEARTKGHIKLIK